MDGTNLDLDHNDLEYFNADKTRMNENTGDTSLQIPEPRLATMSSKATASANITASVMATSSAIIVAYTAASRGTDMQVQPSKYVCIHIDCNLSTQKNRPQLLIVYSEFLQMHYYQRS